MAEVHVIDDMRMPIRNFTGSLSNVRTDNLAACVIKGLSEKFPYLDANQVVNAICMDS